MISKGGTAIQLPKTGVGKVPGVMPNARTSAN